MAPPRAGRTTGCRNNRLSPWRVLLLSFFIWGNAAAAMATDHPTPSETPLWFLAAEAGDVAMLERLVDTTNVDAVIFDGLTALMIGAGEGRLAAVQWLVERGAVLDLRDDWGYTALFHALLAKQWDTARFLVKKGADLRLASAEGNTPLHIGALYAPAPVLRALLRAGAPLNVTNATFGATPLLNAVQEGNTAAVRALTEADADIEKTDFFGWTPLRKAAFLGLADVVAVLVRAGARLNEADHDGWTALHYAASRDDVEVLRVLVTAGADFTARTAKGETPRAIADARGKLTAVEFLPPDR